METFCCDSLSTKKGKRPLFVCDSIYRESDEQFVSDAKKARVADGFDCDPSTSPLLSVLDYASTVIEDKSTSLVMDDQQSEKVEQTPKPKQIPLEPLRLEERTVTASTDNKATSKKTHSAVTPVPSKFDLKESVDGDKESVVSTSTGGDSDCPPISRIMPKRFDSPTTPAHPLMKIVSASVTPFPSTVNLREPSDRLSKREADCDSPLPVEDMPVACLDSSEVPLSTNKTTNDVKLERKDGCRGVFQLVTLFLLFLCYYTQSNSRPFMTSKHTVYVPGAGFSGFWYTLGKLRSISNPSKKEFYCYSSGCLAAVTILRNFTVDQAYDKARAVQVRWQDGDLHRYEVVAAFIDDLLDDATVAGSTQNTTAFDPKPLLSLNIITSMHSGGWLRLTPEIRRADSLDTLRTMLLQTTWIPFAVGGSLWHDDHMDGAFTAGQHPLCALEVGLPWNFGMIMNAVNINLGKDKVDLFYKMGLEHGF